MTEQEKDQYIEILRAELIEAQNRIRNLRK